MEKFWSGPKQVGTHQNRRIIWDILWRWELVLFLLFRNLDVLDITPSEDNVVEFLVRGWDEVVGFATFCTV